MGNQNQAYGASCAAVLPLRPSAERGATQANLYLCVYICLLLPCILAARIAGGRRVLYGAARRRRLPCGDIAANLRGRRGMLLRLGGAARNPRKAKRHCAMPSRESGIRKNMTKKRQEKKKKKTREARRQAVAYRLLPLSAAAWLAASWRGFWWRYPLPCGKSSSGLQPGSTYLKIKCLLWLQAPSAIPVLQTFSGAMGRKPAFRTVMRLADEPCDIDDTTVTTFITILRWLERALLLFVRDNARLYVRYDWAFSAVTSL